MLLAFTAPGLSPAAPPLLLKEVLRGDVDVTRYWVSEKLDGSRPGDGRSLRWSGRPANAPEWFIAGLPAELLDGELWTPMRRVRGARHRAPQGAAG